MTGHIFQALDWAIIAISMILSVGIGVYFRFSGGKQKTNEEYLMANRNMSIFPVATSLMASFLSAVSLLGISSEMYFYGAMFAVANISYGIATPIITTVYLPVFFGLQRTSTYEYLELRFGPKIRMIASITYTLQMILYNGIVLYAPAIVLEAVTSLDRLVSILLVGLICTFYSTLGGMKAVLYTDILQTLLMYLSVLGVFIHGTIKVGGIQHVFRRALDGERLNFLNFSLDPTERHTWWSILIGGIFTHLAVCAVNHTQVQRLLTVSTLEKSRWCVWISWPLLSLLSLSTCLSGLAIYAVYRHCDPLTAGEIDSTNQLMPYYVVDMMSDVPGLLGLFVAGIFSASLSTISAACNSLAAVTFTDYIGRWCKVRESVTPWLTKLVACGYGLVFLSLAFLAEHLGGVLQAALVIFGAVGGPLLGVFSLGMFTTYGNELGASTGLVSGIAVMLWMSFGSPRPPLDKLALSVSGCAHNVTLSQPVHVEPSTYLYLYRISYMWTCPMGFLWVMVIGSLVSMCSRKSKTSLDPALFTPLLAERMRRFRKEDDKPSVQAPIPLH